MTAQCRHRFPAMLPHMRTVATPWGKAEAVEAVSVAQRSGERRFATVVELLETAAGERLVRFAYATGGTARRGPVTLRAKDVERLHKLLERTPELQEALIRGSAVSAAADGQSARRAMPPNSVSVPTACRIATSRRAAAVRHDSVP
jgi:hypothetical protein